MYNYQAEFMAYLDEVKGMNSEDMSNGMMKAEFRGFVEDFNTATMVRLFVLFLFYCLPCAVWA